MTDQEAARSIIKRLDQTYEYDREPVSEDKLEPGRHFAGNFAGEHVAATEFVISALFVSWGAGVTDIIFGLILGNLMAVLSWAFICSPIAVDTRLTLYWYLRKIAGPFVTIIYNVLNAVLYCVLAGAMITVAASAVRIPFGIPPQTGWIPTDLRFVLVVLVVGAVVVTLAILGFKRLAQFASLASPWLFVMFIAGAFAMLPRLVSGVPGVSELNSFSDFWKLADTAIWTGESATGANEIGFWHVAMFAWIANLAMHVGLSDMALLRYAKKYTYGYFSAFGMFLGHYLAWIAAGIMGAGVAMAMNTPLIELDAGGVANYALGISGAIAVVIAGWTTSNPTLYRAGLALQAVTPGWPRWTVTLVAGAITTLIACSPFVFTKLLDFVGLYGLLLMPIGAIVFVEHWIFPKIGLTQYWNSLQNRLMNWPALIAWFGSIAVAMILWQTEAMHLFFLLFPTWILTVIVYILLAKMWGADREMAGEAADIQTAAQSESESTGRSEPPTQEKGKPSTLFQVVRFIALVALALCLIIPLRVFLGGTENYAGNVESMKNTLGWLTLIYFVFAAGWAYLKEKESGEF
jgi:NCS1 family nucleobase:cation symporter-1